MNYLRHMEVYRCESTGKEQCFCGAPIPKGTEYRWIQYQLGKDIDTFQIFDHMHKEKENNNE